MKLDRTQWLGAKICPKCDGLIDDEDRDVCADCWLWPRIVFVGIIAALITGWAYVFLGT